MSPFTVRNRLVLMDVMMPGWITLKAARMRAIRQEWIGVFLRAGGWRDIATVLKQEATIILLSR